MKKHLEKNEIIERSIIKKYRDRLWHPFVTAVRDYELIKPGDRIAVCISGGKDSMLMAKLMQQLQKVSDFPFEVVYMAMDPGYDDKTLSKVEDNAKLLNIPIDIFSTRVLKIANNHSKNPCYLCARMRRGYLYSEAAKRGCNKIALGHHFDDVIETTLMSMLYSSQLKAMLPKLRSTNFKGMELIRPMYRIHEKDIIAWANYNGLDFIRCACDFTKNSSAVNLNISKRQKTKELIRKLKEQDPEIDTSIFNSIHNVYIETFPGYKENETMHSFLERFNSL